MSILSTHFIVDEFANHGKVGVFWNQIAANFTEQIAPAYVWQTHSEGSVASVIKATIQAGGRKIILVGNERTIFLGINALMCFSQELRKNLAIGLWPIRDWDTWLYFIKYPHSLNELAGVFKAGYTFPIHLGKVALTRNNQTPQNLYFGRQCDFSYVEESSQSACVSSRFSSLTRFVPFHILARGKLHLEHQNFYEQGGLKMKVCLYPCLLHSLKFNAQDLKQRQCFKLLWQKGIRCGEQWFSLPARVFPKKQNQWRKMEQTRCLNIQVKVWNRPLSLKLDGQPHICTQAHFKIIPNALPIITQMAPIRLKEPAKLWGTLNPKEWLPSEN